MAFSLQFLGTCACDYSPKLKNEYRDCFDKNARRSSCALLNDRFLLDCGDHCLDSIRIAGVDMAKITDIFITHLHRDHYNAGHIQTIAAAADRILRVWVREDAVVPEIGGVEWKRMQKQTEYEVADGLKVTGLLANHDENVFPQHLIFEKDGKKMFYGGDGAWFLNETYYALKNAEFSLFIIDCTTGDYCGDFRMGEHNSIPMLRVMLPSLKTWKAVTESTKTYITHLAPSLHASHEQTVEIMQEMNVDVAYDGLKVEV